MGFSTRLATGAHHLAHCAHEELVVRPKKPGPHRLLFLTESGKAHPLNNVTHAAWRPRTAAEVELVACVGALKKESIGICDYLNAATIVRSTQNLTIFVVAVRSGDVAGFDIPGNYPVSCPTTRTTRRELVGTPASPSLIKAVVLDHLVPVPDCAGTSLHPACYQCWSDVMPADCKSLPSTAYKIEELTAQVGETVTLHWPWSNPYGDLFRSAYQIDLVVLRLALQSVQPTLMIRHSTQVLSAVSAVF
ncbi:MAG: hypothetical protein RLZZ450_7411 [Pseudomonadota bacterium]|jgi:hypothetical protein